MLLLLTIFVQLAIVRTYTPYSLEQTQQIKLGQRNQWENIQDKFKASQTLAFILETRLIFYIKSKSFPQVVKMRAKGYFINDDKKFIEYDQLSPFDVTKIYIYSATGLIVKSQQFYETFAFQVSLKQDQMYQVMFVDGPPGPRKLIQWQIDSQFQLFNDSGRIKQSELSRMSSRIKQVQGFVIQGMHYTGLSQIQQNMINEKFVKDGQYYESYIIFEAVLVFFITAGQIYAIKKLFQTDMIRIL